MKNSHGLDVDYFSRKMERMLNGAGSYTRDEWARECARMAKVADPAVLLEAEFVGALGADAERYRGVRRVANRQGYTDAQFDQQTDDRVARFDAEQANAGA